MKHLIEQFILGTARSAWIVNEHFKMYVRKSRRRNFATGEVIACFDIANVISENPGHGYFSKVFDDLVPLARQFGFEGIYAENVNNVSLRGWFLRHGFAAELKSTYVDGWNAILSLKE